MHLFASVCGKNSRKSPNDTGMVGICAEALNGEDQTGEPWKNGAGAATFGEETLGDFNKDPSK